MPVSQDIAELLALAAQRGVPSHCAEPLCKYLAFGEPVGGFLQSVLANDLYVACKKPDVTNAYALQVYVDFLYEIADPRSYGSYKRYDAWVKTRAYTVDLTEPQNLRQHDGPEGQDRT